MLINSSFLYALGTNSFFFVSFARYSTSSFPFLVTRCWAMGGRRMDLPSCFSPCDFDPFRLIKMFQGRLYWVAKIVKSSSHERLDLSTFLLCASDRRAM